nr:hypothetical protein SETIT_1G057400v2 [Ipomoea batatas]GMD08750.1 hypothetical protein SETIT_1G057400v2 [Ipomoea batatas]
MCAVRINQHNGADEMEMGTNLDYSTEDSTSEYSLTSPAAAPQPRCCHRGGNSADHAVTKKRRHLLQAQAAIESKRSKDRSPSLKQLEAPPPAKNPPWPRLSSSNHGGMLPLQRRIPVVFDRVIGASIQHSSNSRPFIPDLRVRLRNNLILLPRERPVLHLRRQLIAPPQPTRLPRSPWNRLAYQRPVPRAVLLHKLPQQIILLRAPRPLNPIRIRHAPKHRT